MMVEADTSQWQAKEPDATPDPFSNIEADRLTQEIAELYVLLAETVGAPFKD
jgi:hypothetical protein